MEFLLCEENMESTVSLANASLGEDLVAEEEDAEWVLEELRKERVIPRYVGLRAYKLKTEDIARTTGKGYCDRKLILASAIRKRGGVRELRAHILKCDGMAMKRRRTRKFETVQISVNDGEDVRRLMSLGLCKPVARWISKLEPYLENERIARAARLQEGVERRGFRCDEFLGAGGCTSSGRYYVLYGEGTVDLAISDIEESRFLKGRNLPFWEAAWRKRRTEKYEIQRERVLERYIAAWGPEDVPSSLLTWLERRREKWADGVLGIK